ncbi:histone H4 [Mycena vulgaris]|nr:histone H4 [Mycena vulgaris]
MARKRRVPVKPRINATPGTSQPLRPRRRRISRSSLWGVGVGTKPTIKRLGRRGGVKRLSGMMYEETRGCMFGYLRCLNGHTVLYTTDGDRTTVSSDDVEHALRRSGRILYG